MSNSPAFLEKCELEEWQKDVIRQTLTRPRSFATTLLASVASCATCTSLCTKQGHPTLSTLCAMLATTGVGPSNICSAICSPTRKLRRAPLPRRAQLRINLANAFNSAGRIIDALDEWRAALQDRPGIAMAFGSMGKGMLYYGTNLYDGGHAIWLPHGARQLLRRPDRDVTCNAAGFSPVTGLMMGDHQRSSGLEAENSRLATSNTSS